jgi:hypothetical protein
MNVYSMIYEFAASAGALEGYVYRRPGVGQIDMTAMPVWIDNLCAAYAHLPGDVRQQIQGGVDQTLGRAVRSLSAMIGANHPLVERLATMVKGPLPESPDAFDKKKWFQAPAGGAKGP